MKLSTKIIIAAVAVIVVAAICYRAVNIAPKDDLTPTAKLQKIIADGGCISCHTANPNLPFYMNWPIAKNIIRTDVDNGYKAFDMQAFMDALNAGKAPNEADFAKVEKVLVDGTMPLAKYYLVHWGSSITGTKAQISADAAKKLRAEYYPNPLASAEFANETVRPIPDSISVDPRKVELGKMLYFDKRLSADNTVACATCHPLEQAGVDNQRLATGIRGQHGGVNAPTSFNSAFNFVQFWDGRAATLADQAGGPPLNPVEMGCKSFDEIVAKLKADPAFSAKFRAVYPAGLSQATITEAIQEFEKTLLTPNSALDKYLKGNKNAMTKDEIAGYDLFKKHGCATCHVGENFGGKTYDRMGLSNECDYFADRGKEMTDGDKGRFAQTKIKRDMNRFKVPGLRNIALTFPYFHDGYTNSLTKAVEIMMKYECDDAVKPDEINLITKFLNTLTGEYQGKKLTNPKLTASNK